MSLVEKLCVLPELTVWNADQCAVPVVQPLVDKGNRQRLATLKTVGNRHTLVLEAI